MNTTSKLTAAFVLAVGMISCSVYAAAPAADGTPKTAKHAKKAAAKPKEVAASADQLQELKQELQSQITSLKGELADRDAKLKLSLIHI